MRSLSRHQASLPRSRRHQTPQLRRRCAACPVVPKVICCPSRDDPARCILQGLDARFLTVQENVRSDSPGGLSPSAGMLKLREFGAPSPDAAKASVDGEILIDNEDLVEIAGKAATEIQGGLSGAVVTGADPAELRFGMDPESPWQSVLQSGSKPKPWQVRLLCQSLARHHRPRPDAIAVPQGSAQTDPGALVATSSTRSVVFTGSEDAGEEDDIQHHAEEVALDEQRSTRTGGRQ